VFNLVYIFGGYSIEFGVGRMYVNWITCRCIKGLPHSRARPIQKVVVRVKDREGLYL